MIVFAQILVQEQKRIPMRRLWQFTNSHKSDRFGAIGGLVGSLKAGGSSQ